MDEVLRDSERFAVVVADPPWVRRDEVTRYPEDPVLPSTAATTAWRSPGCVDVARHHRCAAGTSLLQLDCRPGRRVARPAGRRRPGRHRGPLVREQRGVLVRLDLTRSRRRTRPGSLISPGQVQGRRIRCDRGRTQLRQHLWVPSHHGRDCERSQRQTAVTGRVVPWRPPSASRRRACHAAASRPAGQSTMSGWSNPGVLMRGPRSFVGVFMPPALTHTPAGEPSCGRSGPRGPGR